VGGGQEEVVEGGRRKLKNFSPADGTRLKGGDWLRQPGQLGVVLTHLASHQLRNIVVSPLRILKGTVA
jgi:hypothetical protein